IDDKKELHSIYYDNADYKNAYKYLTKMKAIRSIDFIPFLKDNAKNNYIDSINELVYFHFKAKDFLFCDSSVYEWNGNKDIIRTILNNENVKRDTLTFYGKADKGRSIDFNKFRIEFTDYGSYICIINPPNENTTGKMVVLKESLLDSVNDTILKGFTEIFNVDSLIIPVFELAYIDSMNDVCLVYFKDNKLRKYNLNTTEETILPFEFNNNVKTINFHRSNKKEVLFALYSVENLKGNWIKINAETNEVTNSSSEEHKQNNTTTKALTLDSLMIINNIIKIHNDSVNNSIEINNEKKIVPSEWKFIKLQDVKGKK